MLTVHEWQEARWSPLALSGSHAEVIQMMPTEQLLRPHERGGSRAGGGQAIDGERLVVLHRKNLVSHTKLFPRHTWKQREGRAREVDGGERVCGAKGSRMRASGVPLSLIHI